MIHNRSAKKYLRRARGMLPCSRRMKGHVMEQIGDEISLFLKEYPDADYSALTSRFGGPEAIAASYIESVCTADILKKLRIRKWIVSAVATVLVFVSLIWASVAIYAVIRNEQSDGGHVEVVIENT